MEHQPWLHDLVSCLSAPTVVLSDRTGEIHPEGVTGLLMSDRRLIARLYLTVGGQPTWPMMHELVGASAARFQSAAREVGDIGPDPVVIITQERRAHADGFTETITVNNYGTTVVESLLTLWVGSDLLTVPRVKEGQFGELISPTETGPDFAIWRDENAGVRVSAMGARVMTDGVLVGFDFNLQVLAGASRKFEVNFHSLVPAVFKRPAQNPLASAISASSRDPRLAPLVGQSIADLRELVLADPMQADESFVAAGSPWFFTLFGRDSLWVARMLLPFSVEVAWGTLRTLARRQGEKHEIAMAEAPGKIMHELRAGPPAGTGEHTLPPSYFGTIDATELWISLLHDAWRWGLDEDRVRQLLPNLLRAVDWLLHHSGLAQGFVKYIDESGRGLANQGWKDSGNSVQHSDGRLAPAPIALCEVQAYSYEALVNAADLLEGFAIEPDLVVHLRAVAQKLKSDFRAAFWVDVNGRRYPAIAIDGNGEQVAAATSNIGQVIGSGLLDRHEEQLVVDVLTAPDMFTEFGLRTLSADHPRFNPVGYQIGSIWSHDTAIALKGMHKSGFSAAAKRFADSVIAAGAAFDNRMPELFSGEVRPGMSVPSAYPASCRPQAWSAASALVAALAALEIEVDVPGDHVSIRPDRAFSDWWPMEINGLNIAGHTVAIAIDSDGNLSFESELDLMAFRAGGTG